MYLRNYSFLILFLCFVSSFTAHSQNISLQDASDFRVEKIEGKMLILSFKLKLENESNKNIGVTVQKGKVYKDGELLGAFKLLEKIKLKKHSSDAISIRIQVDLDKELNILKHIQSLLMGSIELRVTGKVKTTWFILSKKYPFDYSEKLSATDFLR